MNKIEEISKIEKEIKILVGRYAELQKKYKGDNAYSRNIEEKIDILEQRQKKLLEGKQ